MSSVLQSEHGHGDALLFDAHQLLSELMGDGTAAAAVAPSSQWPSSSAPFVNYSSSNNRSPSDISSDGSDSRADEETLWPQRASDALMDAMLFQDIDTLLVTASSSDLATPIDLHPTTAQQHHSHNSHHHMHDHSIAGYLHSPSAPHTHDSASLASVVDWLSTAHASSTAAPAAPLRAMATDADAEMAESDDADMHDASDAAHTVRHSLSIRST